MCTPGVNDASLSPPSTQLSSQGSSCITNSPSAECGAGVDPVISPPRAGLVNRQPVVAAIRGGEEMADPWRGVLLRGSDLEVQISSK